MSFEVPYGSNIFRNAPPWRRAKSSELFPKGSTVSLLLLLCASVALLLTSGCRKDVASAASDSDANGYLCLECGAKLYTSRAVFLAQKCPKCQRDSLIEVVGYACPKDQHVTIRGRSNDRRGAVVCEQCQGPLSGMRLPREKDLKAWGATKAST